MPAPSDSFIVDYVRAEGAVSSTALDLALGRRRKSGKTGHAPRPDAPPLPLALELVASGALSLERYLEALAAHERRSATCPSCGTLRYAWRLGGSQAPCPGCGDAHPPRLDPTTSELTPSVPGELRFEDYTIEQELGRGGMGIVYRALYRPAQRVDALKLLLPQAQISADRIARFHRERALLARVQDPAIVAIHRAGEHGGLEFLALELVPGGRTLRSVVEKGPQSVALSCRLVTAAARGLEAAHRAGVLHRDLKPENILVDDELKPHIADFGLARALEDVTNLTRSGSMVGTPLYMSAEQLQGKRDLDERCDVYALAVVLYELLAGAHPHAAATTLPELVERVKKDEAPPIRALRDDVPPALEAVLCAAMARHRELRPRRAMDLARAIEEAASGRASRLRAGITPLGPRLREPRVRIALAALACVVALSAATLMVRRTGLSATSDESRGAWAAARERLARAARAAIDRAEEVARSEGRGSASELETAALALETGLQSLGPAPDSAGVASDLVPGTRRALAVARARTILVTASDTGPGEALTVLERAPARDEVATERGEVLLDLGRTAEALVAFEVALRPPGAEPGVAARASLGRARALVRLGREVEARDDLERLARGGGPEAFAAWTELASLEPETGVPVPVQSDGVTVTPLAVAIARSQGRAPADALVALAASGFAGTRARGEALLASGFPEVAAEVLDSAAAARDPLEAALARAAEGEALVAAGRPGEAADPLRLALASLERPLPGPGDPVMRRRRARSGKARALVAQGDAAWLAGDVEGARQRYEAASRAAAFEPAARARLAELLLASHESGRAQLEAEAALAADARSAAAGSALVSAALLQGHVDPSLLAMLDRALLSTANGARSPARRADLLAARARLLESSRLLGSDLGGARASYIEAAELDRRDPWVRRVRSETYAARVNTEAARAASARARALARLAARPRSAALEAALAEACIAAGLADDAEHAADAAIAANSELGEGHLARANVLARALHFEQAVAEYRLARERGAPRAEVGVNLGFTLDRIGRGAEAVDAFDDAIAWEPFSSPMYGGRAAALLALGRRDESEADRDRQASFTNPPDSEWKAALARAEREERAHPATAAGIYEELLRTRPYDGEVWFRRGIVTLRRSETLLGLALLGRAVYGNPSLERELAPELERTPGTADPALAATLARGVPERPDLDGEAAYVAAVLELMRIPRASPPDAAAGAARALVLLERALAERPVLHAARLSRGLAESLAGAPRVGAADARDAFALWPSFDDACRVTLGVALERAGDPAGARELRRAFDADPEARRRFELAFRSR